MKDAKDPAGPVSRKNCCCRFLISRPTKIPGAVEKCTVGVGGGCARCGGWGEEREVNT